jgi:hypothetical protein
MTIRELKNPFTEEYIQIKGIILGKEFSWYHEVSTQNNGINFLSHMVLERPSKDFPSFRVRTNDIFYNLVVKSLKDIFKFNSIDLNAFLRINVNYTFYTGGGEACEIHTDHVFPHKNFLLYLTDSHGPTVAVDKENNREEYFHPKEDAIILFDGKHYHYQPDPGERRIVLVATYI